MINISRAIANQQAVGSQIVCDLFPDREVSGAIQRVLDRMKRENTAERRRMSEREIERIIIRSIIADNPGIDDNAALKLFERRLWNALKPHRSAQTKTTKGMTAADAARQLRQQGVRRRTGARK